MDIRTTLKVMAAGLALTVALAPAGPLAARAYAGIFDGGDTIAPPDAFVEPRDSTAFTATPSGVDTTPVYPSDAGLQASATTTTDAPVPTVGTASVDAPYMYLYTPWHGQERSYWCGPTSCQIVAHYFGNLQTQSTMASFLGTTTSGTSITRVDDCLRHYTGRSYECYTGTSQSSLLSKVAHTIGAHRQPLVADVRINPGTWHAYRYSHAGHILPVEAYDWRYGTVRMNDPYNEASWRSKGGKTGGHITYPVWALACGVALHPQHAVVAAP
jgi:hypothetical protein